ncbi:MAG TPA: hypothetical protein VF960_14910, partial [Chloroflexota bacterium]
VQLGYEAAEHINAFTPATFVFTVQRAGFNVLEAIPTMLSNPLLQRAVRLLGDGVGASVTVVARKDTSFVYPEKRLENFDPKWMESSYRQEI